MLHLFKNFNFAATNVMFFMVGMILFSSTVLMPQFLQTLWAIPRKPPAWFFPRALSSF
jgi:hypothetical protein